MDHPAGDFPRVGAHGGNCAGEQFISDIGNLLPMALCGLTSLYQHPPDGPPVDLRLQSWTGIGKPGPRPWSLLCAKAGDASALRVSNVDFVFIKTHLSRGSCWNS